MANRMEDRIRDYLADNLSILQDGLVLVQKEHVLHNDIGTGGRIDILARDRFGLFVVIEVKRSNQAARTALTEIHKYTALLRVNQGLDESQVRVIVVSTDWNELRIPLAECIDSFPYSIEAFAIQALPDGRVLGVEQIQMPTRNGTIRISKIQGGYFYRNESDRDGDVIGLGLAIGKALVKDFAILALNHVSSNPQVCYPYCLYIIFSSPLRNLEKSEVGAVEGQIGWCDSFDDPDEIFLSDIIANFNGSNDDYEIGYPEKLTGMLTGWDVKKCVRYGRLNEDSSLLTDGDILSLAKAERGGSPIYLSTVCSPKYSALWRRLLLDVADVIKCMPQWEVIVPDFLKEIEVVSPAATVSVFIYNPSNLLRGLHRVALTRDESACPRLEIFVEEDSQKPVRLLVGLLAWNGEKIKESPEQIVERIYGGRECWALTHHFYYKPKEEIGLLAAHNLSDPLVEYIYEKNSSTKIAKLKKGVDGLYRSEVNLDSYKSVAVFSAENITYLSDLKHFMNPMFIDLSE